MKDGNTVWTLSMVQGQDLTYGEESMSAVWDKNLRASSKYS